jgi:GntR family transcriptional regulator/MocR family aminotransferase
MRRQWVIGSKKGTRGGPRAGRTLGRVAFVAIEWSSSNPELLLDLDRSKPLRAQLEALLRDAVRSGRLRAGERVPSSRELARELRVSRGLVQECYGQLIAEGYLTSQHGSATRVAAQAHPHHTASKPNQPPATPPLIASFEPRVPDLSSFPRQDWSWAMREACASITTRDLGYGGTHGSTVLREVLAAYLRRVRAADADTERLIISTGFAQGSNIVFVALARAGIDCIAFEDPGYGPDEADETVVAAADLGMKVTFVPVDDEGVDVAALAATRARAVVVTPAHQAPTGVVLSPRRRHTLVDWAREADAFVIEDDYDSEFRYDSEPVGVLQGLAPERVVTIGTASKALAPAVRLGWVVAPPALADAIATAKWNSDRGTSTLDQLALAALIESGRYDRHLRRMRQLYAARRTTLVTALSHHAPGVRLTGLAAGFHALAHLPAHADEQAVVAAARERHVALTPLGEFRTRASDGTEPCLVLGFGNVGERAIRDGIAAVGDLLS